MFRHFNNMNKSLGNTQRAFIAIALVTVVSKLLGFIRETLVASTYGANIATDSYIVAVTIVTSFYLIMGDVINNTFIPQYLELKTKDKDRSDRFASSIINIILLATIILLGICSLFTSKMVFLFAPGLSFEGLINAVKYTRLLLPTLAITGISIALRSILQANSSFIGPAIMGIPNHMIVIAYLVFGSIYGVKGLVYATAVGTSIQLFAQLPFIKGTGFRYTGLGYYEHKHVVRFIYAMGFILIGSSVNQINTLIDRALASFTGLGNISILNYANMLNLFVSAVFITTITTVVYPKLAESKDLSLLQSRVKEYLRVIITILVPVAFLMVYFSHEIVQVLFGRGSFTAQNVTDTAKVLSAYSLGIIPFGVSELLNRTFYSLGDTKTPMSFGIIAVLTNITLNLILVRYLGIVGLALATSIAAAVYMTVSLKAANKRISIVNMQTFKWLIKTCGIGFAAFAVLYAVDTTLIGIMDTGLVYIILRAAIASLVSLSIYGLLMYKYGGNDGD